ncbi:MAG: preprotein translocase subunit YajC [Bacillota bacterium]
MRLVPFLLDGSTIVYGTDGAGAVATTADAGAGVATASAGSPTMLIIAYIAMLGIVFYFFSVRPMKKKEQQMAQLRSEIAVGDSVLLKTGMFGTVADITYENYIIEFGVNKTVRVPVLKTEVHAKRDVNLSNEAPPAPPAPEKKQGGLFGGKKKETAVDLKKDDSK